MNEFKPRLTAPEKNNPYYFSNKNVFYKYVGGKPNCTRHAYGRFMEAWGIKLPVIKGKARGNAEDWFDLIKASGKFLTSNKPCLGAVACWRVGETLNGDDGAGHVAIVEKINPNGDILTSNGAWGGSDFYIETYVSANGYNWTSKKTGKNYIFQGFIYPFEQKNEQTDNIYKTTGSLHLRSDAGKGNKSLLVMPKGSEFVSNGSFKLVDGVKWLNGQYKGINGWASEKYLKKG